MNKAAQTFLSIVLLFSTTVNGQVPEGLNYQAIARNSAGEALGNTAIGMQISILAGSVEGSSVYTETHQVTTNSFGLFTLIIGNGNSPDSFSAIDWGTGSYFIKIEMDASGGTAYSDFGTSQLLSVPYAMHAKTADNISGELVETDPVFEAHDASGITTVAMENWNLAYGWGDHAAAGYLTSIGAESDPIFEAHAASGILTANITNWDVAFGWGNHADAGYLTSMGNETDPVFSTHDASNVTSAAIGNWNTSYGWGDHSSAGYLTSFIEVDPLYIAWDKSTGISITESQISDLDHFTIGDEADPVFAAHAANGITATNITNWTTAFNWGDHSGAEYFMSGGETSGTNRTLGNTDNYSLGFKTNNETRVFISNTGRLGIGNANPSEMFHLTSATDPNIRVEAPGNSGFYIGFNGAGYMAFSTVHSGTPFWDSMVLREGNLGIGTAAPSEKLDVNGNVKITGKINATGSNANGTFFLTESTLPHTSAHNSVLQITNGSNIANSEANIQFASGSPAHGRATITATHDIAAGTYNGNLDLEVRYGSTSYRKAISMRSNGNVGIGTEDPAEKLSVAGTIESTTGGVKFPDGTVQTTAVSGSECSYNIGDTHEGGIIFYLDASGCHGLICATTDQSTGIQWYSGNNVDTYAYGDGIRAGEGNSSGITRWQGYCSMCNANAICQSLAIGGEDDWYLPSKYELFLMYENVGQGNALGLGNVGGFVNDFYWSSSEHDTDEAWYYTFEHAWHGISSKSNLHYVRAVRAF